MNRIVEFCIFLNIFNLCLSGVTILNSDPVTLKKFSISEFIISNEYPFELHQDVETEDGYLLDLHRIPHGRDGNSQSEKPVIFLMHGLLGSAENWIVLGADMCLAFLLADQGYDVWMGNARGSAHSRKHVELNPDKDDKFWHFSWHEIGIYDLPANIDYIRKTTNKEQISYIGHSQGTTSFFVMTSEKPEYNNYINVMVALAPVAYMNTKNIADSKIAKFVQHGINKLLIDLGVEEMKPSKDKPFCLDLGPYNGLCSNALGVLNIDAENYDLEVFQRCEQTFPAGAAARQFIHYSQEFVTGKFCQFDFGQLTNMKKYGSKTPPSYNLHKISTPIALIYGEKDNLAPPANVERLPGELPNVIMNYMVPSPDFNHFDFLINSDAVDLIYNKILDEISSYKT